MDHLELSHSHLLEKEKAPQSALSDFVQSTLNAGMVSPIRGMAQIVDHSVGSQLDAGIKTGFEAVGIEAPQHAQFGTSSWYAQQLGNAAGMTVPFFLARSAVQRGAANVLGESVVYKSALDIGTTHTLRQFALTEAAISGTTGLLYGTILTPSNENHIGQRSFIADRLKAGASDAAVFGTLGFTAPYMAQGLAKTAAAVESSAIPSIAKAPIVASLENPILHRALAGLPAGLVAAEAGALSDERILPTMAELKESMVGMAFVGGTFAGRQWLSSQREGTNLTNARYLTDKLGLTEKANTQKIEFQLVDGKNELEQLQSSIASGAENAQAKVTVRPVLETFSGAILGREFNTPGDARTLLLDHRSNGTLEMGSMRNINLLATCNELDSALAKHDVFPGRSADGQSHKVWLQLNPETPDRFTLSLNRTLNSRDAKAESTGTAQRLLEVPLGAEGKAWNGSPDLLSKSIGDVLSSEQLAKMLLVPDDKRLGPRPKTVMDRGNNPYSIDPVQVRQALSKTGERFTYDEGDKIISTNHPTSVETTNGKTHYTYQDSSTVTWHGDGKVTLTDAIAGQRYDLNMTRNADGSGTIVYPSGLTKTLRADGSVVKYNPKENTTTETRISPDYFGRVKETTTLANGQRMTEFENSIGKEIVVEHPDGSKTHRFNGSITEFPRELAAEHTRSLSPGEVVETKLAAASVNLGADGKITLSRPGAATKSFELGEAIAKAAVQKSADSNSLSIYAETKSGQKRQIIITENDQALSINRAVKGSPMVEILKDSLNTKPVESRLTPMFDQRHEIPVARTEKVPVSVLNEGLRISSAELGKWEFNSVAMKDGRVVNFDNNGMIESTIMPTSTVREGTKTIYTYKVSPIQNTIISWEGNSLSVKGRMFGETANVSKGPNGQSIETRNDSSGIRIIRGNDNKEIIERNDVGVRIIHNPGSFTAGNEFTITQWQNGKVNIEQHMGAGAGTDILISRHPDGSGTEVQLGGLRGAIEIPGSGEVRILKKAIPEQSDSHESHLYPRPFSRPVPRLVPRMF